MNESGENKTWSMKQKVYAYITYRNRLLVFRHVDFPDAGIQVPGGTVQPGEVLDAAVMREACEESGLSDLELGEYLGMDERRWDDLEQIHQRYFYHVRVKQQPPEVWRHDELDPSDGSPAPIRFEFYWVPLDEVPEMSGFQDCLVGRLVQK